MWRWCVAAAATVLALIGAVLFVLDLRTSRSEERVREFMERSNASSAFVLGPNGQHYLVARARGETALEWARRTRRIADAGPQDSDPCTTLYNCGPYGTVIVCTPCGISGPGPDCDARHAEEVEAFRAEFGCD